nr:HAF repeat-containing protein [Anaerolineae bacterium]
MKTLRQVLLILALLAALALGAIPVAAQHTATDLGTLGGTWSEANGINDGGQIVGASHTTSGETHAFLWENGVITDLGTLGGGESYAYTINNSGQVVGRSSTADGYVHAFLWEKGGMTD